jgi:hypothetical protein
MCSVYITQSLNHSLTHSILLKHNHKLEHLFTLLQHENFPQSRRPCYMPMYETNVYRLSIYNILEITWDSNRFNSKHNNSIYKVTQLRR